MEAGRRAIAGDWLLRLQASELDQQELTAWLDWYNADAANREIFEELQNQYETLRSIPEAQRRELAIRLTAPANESPKPIRVRNDVPWRRVAVAAAVVALAIGTVLSTGYFGAWSKSRSMQTAQYQTPRAEHENVTLPDGSSVKLGALSSISLNFTSDVRYVVLEGGEAYFEVTHDARRPFIVQVGPVTVRAVGTSFNIRRAQERVVVAVSEGVVDVGQKMLVGPTSSLLVSAGRQASVNPTRASVAVINTDAQAIGAWRKGRLEFVDEPLSSVIETVNRYSSHAIVVTDREIAATTYTGTVNEDRIDEWLLALRDVFPVQVSRVGGETILLSGKE
jgi:transmembrane sensor